MPIYNPPLRDMQFVLHELLQIEGAPARPFGHGGGEEDLQLGVGKDGGADVASLHHERRRKAKSPLHVHQIFP